MLVLLGIALAAWIGFRLEFLDEFHPLKWLRADGGPAWHFGDYAARMVMLTAIGVIMAVSLQLINGISGQFSLGHAGFMAVGAYFSGYASSQYNALDKDNAATNFQNVGQVVWFMTSMGMVLAAMAAVLAVVFFVVRQSRRIAGFVPPLLLLGGVAWITWDFSSGYGQSAPPPHLVWTRLIQLLADMFNGSMAHGMGPAMKASLMLPAFSRRPLCMIALLGGGGLMAAVAGLVVGLPTLRLRGDYLAIATLGFAQIITVVFINMQAVGGATGLSTTPYRNAADPDNDPVTHYILPWILAMMVATIVVVWRIAYSPKGRLIRAVREDEIAAAAVGINNTRHKVTAFVVGAFFAGIGGVLYVHADGYVHPADTFGIDKSLLFVVMVTLGGLGSISGAVLAGAILTLLPFLFRQLAGSPSMPLWLRKVFENQLAVFALAMVIMMLIRPRGLLGRRELWPRRRRKHIRLAASSPVGAAAS